MDREMANWVTIARYDLGSAVCMFEGKRYVYAAFMCHMAIEKILKAAVRHATGKTPPGTHDLVYLAGKCDVRLDDDMRDFIADVNDLNVVTRYPEDFKNSRR